MSTNELESKVKELKELKAMAEDLKAEITAIEDDIKAHMGDDEELRAGAYKIRWMHIKSVRFDTVGFKKAMPELYSRFSKETETRRFCIA